MREGERVEWRCTEPTDHSFDLGVSFRSSTIVDAASAEVVRAVARVTAASGAHTATADGQLVLAFGNEFSWWTSKLIVLELSSSARTSETATLDTGSPAVSNASEPTENGASARVEEVARRLFALQCEPAPEPEPEPEQQLAGKAEQKHVDVETVAQERFAAEEALEGDEPERLGAEKVAEERFDADAGSTRDEQEHIAGRAEAAGTPALDERAEKLEHPPGADHSAEDATSEAVGATGQETETEQEHFDFETAVEERLPADQALEAAELEQLAGKAEQKHVDVETVAQERFAAEEALEGDEPERLGAEKAEERFDADAGSTRDEQEHIAGRAEAAGTPALDERAEKLEHVACSGAELKSEGVLETPVKALRCDAVDALAEAAVAQTGSQWPTDLRECASDSSQDVLVANLEAARAAREATERTGAERKEDRYVDAATCAEQSATGQSLESEDRKETLASLRMDDNAHGVAEASWSDHVQLSQVARRLASLSRLKRVSGLEMDPEQGSEPEPEPEPEPDPEPDPDPDSDPGPDTDPHLAPEFDTERVAASVPERQRGPIDRRPSAWAHAFAAACQDTSPTSSDDETAPQPSANDDDGTGVGFPKHSWRSGYPASDDECDGSTDVQPVELRSISPDEDLLVPRPSDPWIFAARSPTSGNKLSGSDVGASDRGINQKGRWSTRMLTWQRWWVVPTCLIVARGVSVAVIWMFVRRLLRR